MVDREDVRCAYDEITTTYTSERVATYDESESAALEALFDSVPDGCRLLDAGCGQGTPALEYALDPSNECDPELAVGLDLSRGQLETAMRLVPDAALCQGEMSQLPFAADTFDTVTALYSLIHVPIDDHQTAIEAFERVLKPGGRLLLTEGWTEWTGSNPNWLESGTEMQWHMAGAKATREQLESAGFELVTTGEFTDALADEEDARFPYFHARLAE
ncbi:methyltransferase type 11 [Natrinema pellirubrum DSM 15624]|uniref:Methylase involved in ubiquinone/menaquinone biosynthesis n=1 Tax=Natrinema pellirubrum (strain DSM 15624 / CIP 106293 / JCM 10476 / NCIMB 786 / 157) TaxID=797303 RepID=L0JIM0_NATP1|nr:class I SAM-dependent methyltransferase [Natrinema pellirubrum]AGB30402.1 methylase involved in ubiquinone/menaquinone biosynthesis [Natrinema pellirubrum DSM 15624]ELY79373.1 methyltransferase type 11 [Natrinema pellirubrum DSM 15624]